MAVSLDTAAPDQSPHLSNRRLGRDALVYGFGTLLGRIAAFIMLPIYTRLLQPADYGLLQMLDLTVEIASILLSAGATLGIMRFYFKEADQGERNRLVVSGGALLLFLNLLGTAAIFSAAPLIHRRLLGGTGSIVLVYIAAVNFTVSGFPVVPQFLMQIEQRSLLFTVSTSAKLLMQLSLNILFLVVFHWGPLGILLSTMLSNSVLGLCVAIWMLRRTGYSFSMRWWRHLERFGIPHQFGAAAMFILAFGDRFFLQSSYGLAAVGVYSLAYQFGFLLSNLGSASFLQAWTPQRFQLLALDAEARDARYNTGMTYLTLVLATLLVGIGLLSRPLLMVMAGPAFRDAAEIVPIVTLCYVVQGWTAAVHFGIDVSERTKFSAYANWISAAVIIVAYAVLIPPLGGFGAAVATLIGFSVRFGLVYFWANRLYPIRYQWRLNAHILAVALLIVSLGLFAKHLELRGVLAVDCLLLCVYGWAIWTAFLDDAAKQFVARTLRLPAQALRLWSLPSRS